ncbi:unnamed protein product [Ixodes pacificus]
MLWSRNVWGCSATYLAQCRISRIDSIDVSGKQALHANSDRHLTASCNDRRAVWVTMRPVVWKASSTMPSSRSEAARWNTLKMFFQPDLIFALKNLLTWELTICATQRTTMSRMVGDRLRLTMCSKGRRKSFWNRKLANSPFSMNFMDSCRRESRAKKATSSDGEQPTRLKCSPSTSQMRDHWSRMRPML